jgi:hypothetical protein
VQQNGYFVTIKTNRELFEEVEHLATTLDGSGEFDDGRRLRDALKISTLPGEILGKLRQELQRLAPNTAMSPEVGPQITEILQYIDHLLH